MTRPNRSTRTPSSTTTRKAHPMTTTEELNLDLTGFRSAGPKTMDELSSQIRRGTVTSQAVMRMAAEQIAVMKRTSTTHPRDMWNGITRVMRVAYEADTGRECTGEVDEAYAEWVEQSDEGRRWVELRRRMWRAACMHDDLCRIGIA